ncbi:MAG TPA: sulfurtransferase, partial [Patescibacteria group bacterium]|nr:sulfurtransferase [Patescibacteria group bacterium]
TGTSRGTISTAVDPMRRRRNTPTYSVGLAGHFLRPRGNSPRARRTRLEGACDHPMSVADPTTASAPAALVSTDWARQHLDDPKVRFLEVDVDTDAYDTGHLPGATGINWKSQLTDSVVRDLVSREELQSLLRAAGVDDDTRIVLYGDNNNWFAAWAYWQLKLFGHRDVRILNGGRKYWLDNGLPLATDGPSTAATDYQLPEPDFSLRAFQNDILPRLGDSDFALVDVRSPAEFNGEIIAPPGMSETAQRAGHIPGAASIPWAQTVREDGTFKSHDELADLYEAKGVTPDKDVIAYCRIGERSSHSWFVLHELLGYKRVRNYDGSWTEWGSMVGMPIEKPAPAAV